MEAYSYLAYYNLFSLKNPGRKISPLLKVGWILQQGTCNSAIRPGIYRKAKAIIKDLEQKIKK